MTSTLYMYTVYDHPKDHPEHFVVRKFAIEPGITHPTEEVWLFYSLLEARQSLNDRGLVCLPRFTKDDPKIIETWM